MVKNPKRLPPITKKLRLASEILSDERFCDSDDLLIAHAVQAGFLTPKQVYAALKHFGYRWQDGKWKKIYPEFVRNAYRLSIRVARWRSENGKGLGDGD